MTRRFSRRMRAAALAAIVALGLGGCAVIPRSGPVHVGHQITSGQDQFTLNYIPNGPVSGASQEDVLRGFIEAASSPQNHYAIAREFLAPDVSSTWNPDKNVTVDLGTGRQYVRTSDTGMQLAVDPVADVDADGDYREVTPSAPVTLQYSFARVTIGGKKEWRISEAPDGIVLDQSTFSDVFGAYPLYYFSPDFAYLVPDLRWFPTSTSPSTATRIVKALLAGPSSWLANKAVVSAFPQGTQLSADSVPVVGSKAQIDLNGEANNADPTALQEMKLQLLKSLGGLSSVSDVTLLIEGNEVQVPDMSANTAPVANPRVDGRPLVYRDGSFGFLSGKEIKTIPGLSSKVAALQPRAVTVSADHTEAAVLTASGVELVRNGSASPVTIDTRPGLIAPSLDVYGYVWSVPAGRPDQLIVRRAGGAASPVATPWPEATSIVSLNVSRDGTRLIAQVRTGNENRLVAAAIIRGDDDVPKQLGEALELTAGSGVPVGSTWVDELTVASLSRQANGDTVITEQKIGGRSSQSSGPKNATVVVGAGTEPRYWVLTASGSLQAGRGTGWQEWASGVSVIATQLGTP